MEASLSWPAQINSLARTTLASASLASNSIALFRSSWRLRM
jgi:hypothetical protein